MSGYTYFRAVMDHLRDEEEAISQPSAPPAPGDFEMTEQEASEFYHMPRAMEETQ